MNYTELFHSMHPGFFQEEGICAMPRDWVFTELVMDLRGDLPNVTPLDCPNEIVFGEYHGEIAALRDAVRQVDEDWVQYFKERHLSFAGKASAWKWYDCPIITTRKKDGLRYYENIFIFTFCLFWYQNNFVYEKGTNTRNSYCH